MNWMSSTVRLGVLLCPHLCYNKKLSDESEMGVYGKPRQPVVDPCVVHCWDVDGGLLLSAQFPPQPTRITEFISKRVSDCFFKAALTLLSVLKYKKKVLPSFLGSSFTMLWPPSQTGGYSLSNCWYTCVVDLTLVGFSTKYSILS